MTQSPLRRRLGSSRGMSMIEMMISLFISTVFMLAAGTAYLVNQKAYRANTEKLRLQQRASEVLEIMEREIRKGASVTIPGGDGDRIQIFNLAGIETARFRLSNTGPNFRLFQNTDVLAQQELITLQFKLNPDGTAVLIRLTLADVNKNRVSMRATAALRNSAALRNIQ